MKNIFLSMLALLFAGLSGEKPTAEEFTLRVLKNYQQHHSMSYDVNTRMKFLNKEDTLEEFSQCVLIRKPKDTLFGGLMWIGLGKRSAEMIYDAKNIYLINNVSKKITEYNPPAEYDNIINYGSLGEYKYSQYFNTKDFVESISDTNNDVILRETLCDGIPCWHLHIEYQDEGLLTDMVCDCWFSKDELVPKKWINTSKLQGHSSQYNEMIFKNVEFDRYDESDLAGILAKKMDSGFVAEKYTPKPDKRKPLLGPGETAPDFTGERYSDGSEVRLSDYKGKVVALDYWFMMCGPCLRAIPEINKLHKKFIDKDVIVLGINPKDRERKDKFPTFLKHNELDYPIIFTDKKAPDSYNVTGYPAVFIIGRDGKIVHSHTGYYEGMHKDLDSIITVAL